MPTMLKRIEPDAITTVGATVADREEFRRFADARGMAYQRVLGLLLEGWRLLSPEQEAEAMRRFSVRRPRRRRGETVGAT